MLNTGEARDWPKLVTIDGVDVEIDRLFAAGDTDRWLNTAEYVVHPPVGKWMIGPGRNCSAAPTIPPPSVRALPLPVSSPSR